MLDCSGDIYIVKIIRREVDGYFWDNHIRKYLVINKDKVWFADSLITKEEIIYLNDYFKDWTNPTETELSLFQINFGFSIKVCA